MSKWEGDDQRDGDLGARTPYSSGGFQSVWGAFFAF
jgi:hypothetical protein